MKQRKEFDRVTRKLTKDQLFGSEFTLHYFKGPSMIVKNMDLESILLGNLEQIDFITAA